MLKLIFWVILGYILYRWLLGNRLPAGQQGSKGNQHSSRREGDIRVDRKPPQNRSPFAEDGEYVDYEEVD